MRWASPTRRSSSASASWASTSRRRCLLTQRPQRADAKARANSYERARGSARAQQRGARGSLAAGGCSALRRSVSGRNLRSVCIVRASLTKCAPRSKPARPAPETGRSAARSNRPENESFSLLLGHGEHKVVAVVVGRACLPRAANRPTPSSRCARSCRRPAPIRLWSRCAGSRSIRRRGYVPPVLSAQELLIVLGWFGSGPLAVAAVHQRRGIRSQLPPLTGGTNTTSSPAASGSSKRA
jgi:hypothetical protein